MAEPLRIDGNVLHYLARVFRFAVFGRLPERVEDVPVWALCVPYRLWREVIRYDGRTFEQYYTPGMSPAARRLLPLRTLYLFFLFLWPAFAFTRALGHGRRFLTHLRHSLYRPDLVLFHPHSDYTDLEVAWGRPDYELGMHYAFEFAKTHAEMFFLDDKQRFVEAAAKAGLPLPPTLTADEALARGGRYIVKDPTDDLGFGVALVDAEELKEVPPEERRRLVVQERLQNHPALLAALPEDGPLSSFRVITLRHPDTGELVVSRCAIRIGRAGMDVDNTAQGGFWCRLDPRTGEIMPGIMKKDFGTVVKGEFVRHRVHPDTGKAFAGLRIPWWDEGRRMALDAHRRLAPDAIALGWDVALAAGQPVFLEVNFWTASYDYEPPDDAFDVSCRAILKRVRELSITP